MTKDQRHELTAIHIFENQKIHFLKKIEKFKKKKRAIEPFNYCRKILQIEKNYFDSVIRDCEEMFAEIDQKN